MIMNFISFPSSVARICFLLFMFFTICCGLRISSHHFISVKVNENGASRVDQPRVYSTGGEAKELATEVYPTGSSLPDCSHACGACFPCKRVMVSLKCLIVESCPVVYRCKCRGKYYHVPSN